MHSLLVLATMVVGVVLLLPNQAPHALHKPQSPFVFFFPSFLRANAVPCDPLQTDYVVDSSSPSRVFRLEDCNPPSHVISRLTLDFKSCSDVSIHLQNVTFRGGIRWICWVTTPAINVSVTVRNSRIYGGSLLTQYGTGFSAIWVDVADSYLDLSRLPENALPGSIVDLAVTAAIRKEQRSNLTGNITIRVNRCVVVRKNDREDGTALVSLTASNLRNVSIGIQSSRVTMSQEWTNLTTASLVRFVGEQETRDVTVVLENVTAWFTLNFAENGFYMVYVDTVQEMRNVSMVVRYSYWVLNYTGAPQGVFLNSLRFNNVKLLYNSTVRVEQCHMVLAGNGESLALFQMWTNSGGGATSVGFHLIVRDTLLVMQSGGTAYLTRLGGPLAKELRVDLHSVTVRTTMVALKNYISAIVLYIQTPVLNTVVVSRNVSYECSISTNMFMLLVTSTFVYFTGLADGVQLVIEDSFMNATEVSPLFSTSPASTLYAMLQLIGINETRSSNITVLRNRFELQGLLLIVGSRSLGGMSVEGALTSSTIVIADNTGSIRSLSPNAMMFLFRLGQEVASDIAGGSSTYFALTLARNQLTIRQAMTQTSLVMASVQFQTIGFATLCIDRTRILGWGRTLGAAAVRTDAEQQRYRGLSLRTIDLTGPVRVLVSHTDIEDCDAALYVSTSSTASAAASRISLAYLNVSFENVTIQPLGATPTTTTGATSTSAPFVPFQMVTPTPLFQGRWSFSDVTVYRAQSLFPALSPVSWRGMSAAQTALDFGGLVELGSCIQLLNAPHKGSHSYVQLQDVFHLKSPPVRIRRVAQPECPRFTMSASASLYEQRGQKVQSLVNERSVNSALLAAGLVSAVSSAASVMHLQRSVGLLRAASCDDGADVLNQPLDVATSPTQWQLSAGEVADDQDDAHGAWFRGAIVGNTLILVGAVLLGILAVLIAAHVKGRLRDHGSRTRHRRRDHSEGPSSFQESAAAVAFPGVLLPLYMAIAPPLLGCAVSLWSTQRDSHPEVDYLLSGLGMVVSLAPAVGATVLLLRSEQQFDAIARRTRPARYRQRGREFHKESASPRARMRQLTWSLQNRLDRYLWHLESFLFQPVWEWHNRSHKKKNTTTTTTSSSFFSSNGGSRPTRTYFFVERFGALFEGLVAGRHWWALVDLWVTLVSSGLSGILVDSSIACTSILWCNFTLAAGLVLSAVCLRPYNSRVEWLMAMLGAVTTLAMCVAIAVEASDSTLQQILFVQLILGFLGVALWLLELHAAMMHSLATRRTSMGATIAKMVHQWRMEGNTDEVDEDDYGATLPIGGDEAPTKKQSEDQTLQQMGFALEHDRTSARSSSLKQLLQLERVITRICLEQQREQRKLRRQNGFTNTVQKHV